MCVMLCAIPRIDVRVGLPSVLENCSSMQRGAVVEPNEIGSRWQCEKDYIDEAKLPQIMKRSAWLQAYFQRQIERERLRVILASENLPEVRHHPLEAIANTWRWLLAIFSWRSN